MKNILITGVSGGIGQSLTEKLLVSGISVIGVDLHISEEMQKTKSEFPELLSLSEYDLMDVEHLSDMIKKIVSEHGEIGGFVHCAGFDKMFPVHMTKIADVENLYRIHALVPMIIISIISKKKYHCPETSIVLISSQSAHEGAMGHSAYASAKGAVEGFLPPASAELMEKGIRLNAVCLAPIKTPMSEDWISKLTNDEINKLLAGYPMGIGNVTDASNLIFFLLSQESRYINGQIITADGGHSVRKI